VWIDGDYAGSSPVTRRIAPGPHVVEAGPSRDERTERRSVTIEPGEIESVVVR